MAQSAQCKAISSSRVYAAFQSHLVQATRMFARGSSTRRVAKLDYDVHSFDVAVLAQSLAETVHEGIGLRFRGNPKNAVYF